MREKRNAYIFLMGKLEGKRPLGRLRWKDSNKKDLGEIGWGGMEWFNLAKDKSPVES
jgi:hypothetical protein